MEIGGCRNETEPGRKHEISVQWSEW